MIKNAKQLDQRKCPFQSADLSKALEVYKDAVVQALNDQKSLDQVIRHATEQASAHDSLMQGFNQLDYDLRKQLFAKAFVYSESNETLTEIISCLKDLRSNFPESHGLAQIQYAQYLPGQGLGVQAVAHPDLKNLSKAEDLHQLISLIVNAQLPMCKQVCYAVIEEQRAACPVLYKLIDEMLKSLPLRNADNYERFISSGFEAACLMPLELERVNIYKAIEELGADNRPAVWETDFSAEDLNRMFANSAKILTYWAQLTFTDFNDQRRTVCHPEEFAAPRWALDHRKFTLNGQSGDSDLSIDFKDAPVFGNQIAELQHGCLGIKWLAMFSEWAAELSQAYIRPNLPRLSEKIAEELAT